MLFLVVTEYPVVKGHTESVLFILVNLINESILCESVSISNNNVVTVDEMETVIR